jgi:hypothetical protein
LSFHHNRIIPASRRPLLSHEDNDVVSNYFSKKQKGYGLLSVFNKVTGRLLRVVMMLLLP